MVIRGNQCDNAERYLKVVVRRWDDWLWYSHSRRLVPRQVIDLGIDPFLIALALLDYTHTFPTCSTLDVKFQKESFLPATDSV